MREAAACFGQFAQYHENMAKKAEQERQRFNEDIERRIERLKSRIGGG